MPGFPTAGINTEATVRINVEINDTAAWRQFEQSLGVLKSALNGVDLSKFSGQFTKMKSDLKNAQAQIKALTEAQKTAAASSQASAEKTTKATKDAVNAIVQGDEKAIYSKKELAQLWRVYDKSMADAENQLSLAEKERLAKEKVAAAAAEMLIQNQFKNEKMLENERMQEAKASRQRAISMTRDMDTIAKASAREVSQEEKNTNAIIKAEEKRQTQLKKTVDREIAEDNRAARAFAAYEASKSKAAAMAAARIVSSTIEEKAALANEMTTLKGRLTIFERSVDAVFRAAFRMQMAGQQLSQFGRSVITSLGSMMSTFGDFQYTLNRAAGSMVDLTLPETQQNDLIGEMQTGILDLSKDMRLIPAKDVAEAMYFWGSTTGQVVNSTDDLSISMKALEPIMKAAIMTNTDYEATIKGVYSILTQYYNGSLDQAATVTEKLFLITQKTAAEFPDLINSFKMVGPIAAANASSFDDMVTLFGKLADLGVRGTMAGRAVRQMFLQLVAPSKAAAGALTALFASVSAGIKDMGGRSYFDLVFPKGQFGGVTNYIHYLAEATDQLSASSRNALLKRIGTANEASVLIALVSKARQEIHGLASDSKTAGDLAAQSSKYFETNWKRVSQSWNGVVGSLQRGWDALKIQVGSTMAKVFAPMLDQLTKLLSKLQDWAKVNPAIVASFGKIAAYIGAFAALAGAVLTTAGALMSLVAVTYVVVRSFAPLAGTIGGLVSLFGAFLASIVRNAGYISSRFQEAMDNLNNTFKDGTDAANGFLEIIQAFIRPMQEFTDAIVKSAADLMVWVTNIIAFVAQVNGATPIVKALAAALGAMLTIRLFSNFVSWIGIIDKFKGTLRALTAEATLTTAVLKDGTSVQVFKSAGAFTRLGESMAGATGVMAKFGAGAKSLLGSIGPLGIFAAIVGVGYAAYVTDFMGFGKAVDKLTDQFRDLQDEINKTVQAFGDGSSKMEQAAGSLAMKMVGPLVHNPETDFFGALFDNGQVDAADLKDYSDKAQRMQEAILTDWATRVQSMNDIIQRDDTINFVPFTGADFATQLNKLFANNQNLSSDQLANSVETMMIDIAEKGMSKETIDGVWKKITSDPSVKAAMNIGEEAFVNMFFDPNVAAHQAAVAATSKTDAIWKPIIDELARQADLRGTTAPKDLINSIMMMPAEAALGPALAKSEGVLGQNLADAFGQLSEDAQRRVTDLLKAMGMDISGVIADNQDVVIDPTGDAIKALGQALGGQIAAGINGMEANIFGYVNDPLQAFGATFSTGKFADAMNLLFQKITPDGQDLIDLMKSGDLPEGLQASVDQAMEYLVQNGFDTNHSLDGAIKAYADRQTGTAATETAVQTVYDYASAFADGLTGKGALAAIKKAFHKNFNANAVGSILHQSASDILTRAFHGAGGEKGKAMAYSFITSQIEVLTNAINGAAPKNRQKIVNQIMTWFEANKATMPKQELAPWQKFITETVLPEADTPRMKRRAARIAAAAQRALAVATANAQREAANAARIAGLNGPDAGTSNIPKPAGTPWNASHPGKDKDDVYQPPKPPTITKAAQGLADVISSIWDKAVALTQMDTTERNAWDAIIVGLRMKIYEMSQAQQGADLAQAIAGAIGTGLTVASGLPSLAGDIDTTMSNTVNIIGDAFGKYMDQSVAFDNHLRTAYHTAADLADDNTGEFYAGGVRVGNAYGDGFGYGALTSLPGGLSTLLDYVAGNSPPKKGPLKDIDKGGYNVGMAWSKGLVGGAADGLRKEIHKVNDLAVGRGDIKITSAHRRKVELAITVSSKDGSVTRMNQQQIRNAMMDALTESDLEHMVMVG